MKYFLVDVSDYRGFLVEVFRVRDLDSDDGYKKYLMVRIWNKRGGAMIRELFTSPDRLLISVQRELDSLDRLKRLSKA